MKRSISGRMVGTALTLAALSPFSGEYSDPSVAEIGQERLTLATSYIGCKVLDVTVADYPVFGTPDGAYSPKRVEYEELAVTVEMSRSDAGRAVQSKYAASDTIQWIPAQLQTEFMQRTAHGLEPHDRFLNKVKEGGEIIDAAYKPDRNQPLRISYTLYPHSGHDADTALAVSVHTDVFNEADGTRYSTMYSEPCGSLVHTESADGSLTWEVSDLRPPQTGPIHHRTG